MNSIFISYRRAGTSGYGGRLQEDLRDHFGKDRVFRDIDSIRPGSDFAEVIEQAVARAGIVLVLIGANWLNATNNSGGRRLDDPDDFVRLEIEAALEHGIVVVPVLVENAKVPSPADLPESLVPLGRRQGIEVSDERWEYDLSRLVRLIEEVIDVPTSPPVDVIGAGAAVSTTGTHAMAKTGGWRLGRSGGRTHAQPTGRIPVGVTAASLGRPGPASAGPAAAPFASVGLVRPAAKRRLVPAAVLSVVVLLLLSLLAAVTQGRESPRIRVPVVVDLDFAAAAATLRRVGFVVHTETRPEERIPGGIVVAQDPAGGTSAKKGAAINLKISDNNAKLAVPSVTMLTTADAIAVVHAAGLNANVVEQRNEVTAVGIVFLQMPDARTTVDKGSTVTLTVSTGTAPATSTPPPTSSPTTGKTSPRSKQTVTLPPPTPPPNSPPAVTCSQENLIANGGFEDGFNGWVLSSGAPQRVTYGQPGFQAQPAEYLGSAYAVGGPAGPAAGIAATLEQTVSLAPCQAGIAAGGKVIHYGGWLGGYLAQGDTVVLAVYFRAGDRVLDGTCTLDGPTAADRGGITKMIEIGAPACPIPSSATAAMLQVRFTWDGTGAVSQGSYDNAYLYVG